MLTGTCKGWSDGGDSGHSEMRMPEVVRTGNLGYGGETGACFDICFSSVLGKLGFQEAEVHATYRI